MSNRKAPNINPPPPILQLLDDRTIDLHSLSMIMALLSTISIMAHNGLNGLFVPPWQRQPVRRAMLTCTQAHFAHCIQYMVQSDQGSSPTLSEERNSYKLSQKGLPPEYFYFFLSDVSFCATRICDNTPVLFKSQSCAGETSARCRGHRLSLYVQEEVSCWHRQEEYWEYRWTAQTWICLQE